MVHFLLVLLKLFRLKEKKPYIVMVIKYKRKHNPEHS